MIKFLSENQSHKNHQIPRMINDRFNPENKIQSKSNESSKPDISCENDHNATVT